MEDDHTDDEQMQKVFRGGARRELPTKLPTMSHTIGTENRERTRPSPTRTTPTSKSKATQTPTATSLSDSVLQDDLEDELEPWDDYTVRATHKAGDLLTAMGLCWGS